MTTSVNTYNNINVKLLLKYYSSTSYLYFQGCYVLYPSDRQRTLFYHVLGHFVMFPHQGIVQGRVPANVIRTIT